ncbi:MAG: SulP family inorganic anion transporter [Candidatus Kapabacteria bacterium]|nr:SulP family inorganic anion transporter [Candidatus Kapabacteria bacterium]
MLFRIFPFLAWFDNYSVPQFRLDMMAGLTVALVLIPQSMAYAQLAGLPAYYGLYAAFLPPMVGALFGSSRQLATGPVAVVSLMTATALEPLATVGSQGFIEYAILLALMVGMFQLLLGVLKLGAVVNFLSHPVVNGFTNAAAIIIASSQLSKLFGVYVEKGNHQYETIYRVLESALDYSHLPTIIMAAIAFAIMIGLKKWKPRLPNVLIAVVVTTLISWLIGFEKTEKTTFDKISCATAVSLISEYNSMIDVLDNSIEERVKLTNAMADSTEAYGEKSHQVIVLDHKIDMINLTISNTKEDISGLRTELRLEKFRMIPDEKTGNTFCNNKVPTSDKKSDGGIWRLKIGSGKILEDEITFFSGGAVVGNIPAGLPSLQVPSLDVSIMLRLLPIAIIISLLGFMEAISIAKAMAARTGQRLDPNQELIGQGIANIIGCFGKSYAVSGSFSRSAVNIQAGGVSGLSNVMSGVVVMITLLFFTDLLYHLPQSVLAAIIMTAVVGLLNISGFVHAMKANRFDGIIGIITFVTTLFFAPHLDRGIIIGVLLSLGYYLYRGMKPNIAMLSKHSDGTWRNRDRFGLKQCKHIAVVRYNGSLFFANVSYLEKTVLELIPSMPELRHILLVSNGINELDASGEHMLATLVERLRGAGYVVSFSGMNDHIKDTMKSTYLYYKIGENNMYRNVEKALKSIHAEAHEGSDETACPLLEVVMAEVEEEGTV